VLGGGIGDVLQYHDAVLGKCVGVIFVDGAKRAAAGGRISARSIFIFGCVKPADHGVKIQIEIAAGLVLQGQRAAPFVLIVEINPVINFVRKHEVIGFRAVGAVVDENPGIALKDLLRLFTPGAAHAEKPCQRAEIDIGGGIGAVGAFGF